MFNLTIEQLYALGYVGIFGLSLASNLIVFVPLPYLAIILVAALSGRFDPIFLIISSGVGSAIGKLIIYQACYSGQRLVDERTKTNLKAFRMFFANYAWVAVLLAASTPIPDDIVYIPLGFARYNRVRFLTATIIGKTLLVSIIVLGASFLRNSFLGSILIGGNQGTSLVEIITVASIFAVLTIVLTYFIARFDWYKWLERRYPERFKKESLD